MPHNEFASWLLFLVYVGVIVSLPLTILILVQCARFSTREQEERRHRINEEVCIGIGEFVAFLLEAVALSLTDENGAGSFLRPMIDGWGGIVLLFISLYFLNRIIIKLFFLRPFQRGYASQLGEALSLRNLFSQMNKTVRVVLLTVIVLVIAVFSLFRIVTVKSDWASTGLKNKYPGYILCEMGSGHNLMFSWNYYRLKEKAWKDLQALLEEVEAEKKWISEYKRNDRYIYLYVDTSVEVSKEEKDRINRREDPQASSSEYYAYLGDYGDRIMEQFMVLKALTGKIGSGTEDESIYQNIIIIYV